MHKLSSRSDHVGVKVPCIIVLAFVKDDLVLPACFDFGFMLFLLLSVSCSAKSPRSLLILLCAWSYSVDCKVEHFFWFYNSDYFVCVQVNSLKNFLFALGLRTVLRMSAWMDDTVHIEIEIVHLRVVLLHFLFLFFQIYPFFVHCKDFLRVLVFFVEVYFVWVGVCFILILGIFVCQYF